MSGSITSANAVYMLTIPNLFNSPQQLQEFSADDIFTTDVLAATETSMGLDGFLSGGFVYTEVRQSISLQANSPSNDMFERWWLQQQIDQEAYIANGTILLKSINKRFTMTRGFISQFASVPDAARTLRPRRHQITWNRIVPANVA